MAFGEKDKVRQETCMYEREPRRRVPAGTERTVGNSGREHSANYSRVKVSQNISYFVHFVVFTINQWVLTLKYMYR